MMWWGKNILVFWSSFLSLAHRKFSPCSILPLSQKSPESRNQIYITKRETHTTRHKLYCHPLRRWLVEPLKEARMERMFAVRSLIQTLFFQHSNCLNKKYSYVRKEYVNRLRRRNPWLKLKSSLLWEALLNSLINGRWLLNSFWLKSGESDLRLRVVINEIFLI